MLADKVLPQKRRKEALKTQEQVETLEAKVHASHESPSSQAATSEAHAGLGQSVVGDLHLTRAGDVCTTRWND